MAQQQRLTYAEIQSLETDIQTTTESMTKQVQNLANMIAQLQSDWKGLGGTAFVRAQEQLNDDHTALRKVLEGIREAVHDTKVGAQTNDEQVLQDLKSVNVGGQPASGLSSL
ncbi:WXG100 family type VII secretion target [Streptomyces sp. ICBB 8177]|uniref:WXG100 family type VII secretion target n=1 Tax=Streptomyces sp. ICBB 8177 TaxID=563922 RepID=UPI0013051B74|nr:WXG100 family type VII secretion target [Streptomyces sp. ICBB 8177]